jgi:hypothetical protein
MTIIRYYRRWDGKTVETEVVFFFMLCGVEWSMRAFDGMYVDSYIVAFFSCICGWGSSAC